MGIMRDNLDKVLERDNKLGMLEDKSETLMVGAKAFRKGAKSLSWTTWWQNAKVYVVIGGFLLLMITIVVVKFVLKHKHQANREAATGTDDI